MRAPIFWKFLLCALFLGLGPAGCADDPAAPPPEQADANRPDNTRDAGEVGVQTPDAGSFNQAFDCGCNSDSCGGAGLCLCSAGQAVCICDAGHGGASCQSCEPGFQDVAGQCRIKLEAVRQEASGDNCEAGGVAIEAGVDTDGNGALDSNELQGTHYVCNAVAPPSSSNDPDAGTGNVPGDAGTDDAGTHNNACTGNACCTADSCESSGACVDTIGGTQCICSTGYSGPRCETCATGFAPDTNNIGTCKLAERLSQTEPEPPSENCTNGGQRTITGLDTNADGFLTPAETDSSTYNCQPSRVLTGDVTVTNQAELDTLRDVTEIHGSLMVRARYIQTLEPLESLSILTGSLIIDDCPSLTGIGGLNRLTRIDGALTITASPLLESIEALSALTAIGGSVDISNDPALQTLSGLQALTRIDGDLNLADNDALTDISGLGSLEVILGNLTLEGLLKLTTLTGFESLHSIGGSLTLHENASLLHVDAMSQLVDSGAFTITANPSLETLDGLAALRSIRGDMNIQNNPSLQQLDHFESLIAVDGLLYLAHNKQLISIDGLNELKSCQSLFILDHRELTSIAGFSNLATINTRCATYAYGQDYLLGEYTILLDSKILEPYPALEAVYGTAVFYSPTKPYFELFGSATHCNEPLLTDIQIRDAPNLASIKKFDGMFALANVCLVNTPLVTTLTLRGSPPTGRLEISGTALTTLDGIFEGSPVSGNTVTISNNPLLTDLGNLPYEELDQLTFRNNARLSDLTGYPPSLTSVDTLTVEGNANLGSLTSIKPTISTLNIVGNAKLPTCLAEAYRDLAPAVTSATTISGNYDGASCTP